VFSPASVVLEMLHSFRFSSNSFTSSPI
jgi:hypothetical protein